VVCLAGLMALGGCGSDEAPLDTNATLPPTGGAEAGASANRPDFVADTSVYSDDLPPERDPAFLAGGDFGPGSTGGPDPIASVYFDFDDFTIRPGERAKLEPVADYLRVNPGVRVVAEGHTDWHGTTEYNMGLSDRRANSVKQYLARLGVRADRVEILALGEIEAQEGTGKQSAAAARDRRVDLLPVGN
jgi:outer membrane protein OmpA-like peptidoglycan-associated protein